MEQLNIFEFIDTRETPSNPCDFTVEYWHFGKDVNPRFKAWLIATNKKPGDIWRSYEYIAWVTGKAGKFKKANNLNEMLPLSHIANGQEEFTKYLMD